MLTISMHLTIFPFYRETSTEALHRAYMYIEAFAPDVFGAEAT